MEIRVVCGDATRVKGADALVVPANCQLTLGWGSHLAEAVLRHAGRGVEREALASHPKGVALGEAVLTSAGRMEGFRHLIHAAVLDRYDFNPLFLLRLKERTSRDTLDRAVRSSLLLAVEAAFSAVVMTPMGAGIGGMRDGVCARVMIGSIRSFAAEHVRTPHVIVACFSRRTASSFEVALNGHAGPGRG